MCPEKRTEKNILGHFTLMDLGIDDFGEPLPSNCIKSISVFQWIHNMYRVTSSSYDTEVWNLLPGYKLGILVLC